MGSSAAFSVMPVIETDVLVVGAGPAGAGLACFLANNGVKGLAITKSPSTSFHPKAHYTNMAAWECLRDLGIESECRDVASPLSKMTYYRVTDSFAGQEYFRAFGCGSDPRRRWEYFDASPCEPADCPQSVMEPILVKYATQNGFSLRYSTQLVSFHENISTGKVETIIEDTVTGVKTLVISEYLCGADGARSSIVEALELPMQKGLGGGTALSVWVEADLKRYMENCEGLIHCNIRMDKPQPEWSGASLTRYYRPYDQWVFNFLAAPWVKDIKVTPEEVMARVKEYIGDDSIEVKIKTITRWNVNECYATQYSRGRVFCLGDAVHRHPPYNGLGSNTCLQDAYNLGWKIAYVLRGQASPSLLETYSLERQPVGKYVVDRANVTMRMETAMFAHMGLFEPDVESRMRKFAELREDSPLGVEKRAKFRQMVEDLDVGRQCLGGEMNQLYESPAVFADDEPAPAPRLADAEEMALRYLQGTFPGARLPHAWLIKPKAFGPRDPLVSTHDLAGHGRFALFTGIGGKESWTAAAKQAAAALGIDVAVHCIGLGQEYEDVFFAWAKKSGVEEKGAVLARPDRTVAWRSVSLDKDTCNEKLLAVLRRVLGRE